MGRNEATLAQRITVALVVAAIATAALYFGRLGKETLTISSGVVRCQNAP